MEVPYDSSFNLSLSENHCTSTSSETCIPCTPNESRSSTLNPKPPSTERHNMLPKRERKVNPVIHPQFLNAEDEIQRLEENATTYPSSEDEDEYEVTNFPRLVNHLPKMQLPNFEKYNRRRSNSLKDSSEILHCRSWRRSSLSSQTYSEDDGDSSDSSLRRLTISPLDKKFGAPSTFAVRSRRIPSIEESKETQSPMNAFKYWVEEVGKDSCFSTDETDSEIERTKKSPTHIPEPPSHSKRKKSYTPRVKNSLQLRNALDEDNDRRLEIYHNSEKRRHTAPAIFSSESLNNEMKLRSLSDGRSSMKDVSYLHMDYDRESRKSISLCSSEQNNVDKNAAETKTTRDVEEHKIEEFCYNERRQSISSTPLEPAQESALVTCRRSSMVDPREVERYRSQRRRVSFQTDEEKIEKENRARKKSIPFTINRDNLEICENPDLKKTFHLLDNENESAEVSDESNTDKDVLGRGIKKVERKSNASVSNTMNEIHTNINQNLDTNKKCNELSNGCVTNTVLSENKIKHKIRRNSCPNISNKTSKYSSGARELLMQKSLKPLGERRKSILKNEHCKTERNTELPQDGRVTATESFKNSSAREQDVSINAPKSRRYSLQEADLKSSQPRRASVHEIRRKTSKARRGSTNEQNISQNDGQRQRRHSLTSERRPLNVSINQNNSVKGRRYSTNTIGYKNWSMEDEGVVFDRTVTLLQRSKQLAETMAAYKKILDERQNDETTSGEATAAYNAGKEGLVIDPIVDDTERKKIDDALDMTEKTYDAEDECYDSDDLYYDTHIASKTIDQDELDER